MNTQALLEHNLPQLTARQYDCLLFVFNCWRDKGHYPSHSEIGRGLGGLSRQIALRHIEGLQGKGCVERSHDRSRNIRITETGLKVLVKHGVVIGNIMNVPQGQPGQPEIINQTISQVTA